MRTYTNVTVEGGAVHVVSPRAGHLGLTEAALDLGNGVREFLTTHVQRGLADPRASAARFVVPGPERASGTCEAILADGSGLVPRSADLARMLYDVSEADERVADGTVAVLRCSATEARFLALLKLDPSDAYRTVERSDGGRARVELVLEEGILPSVRERVQKAAFVRGVGGGDYDMLLVDRQRPGDTVSRFFVQDFLGAELVLDDRARTQALYRTLTTTVSRVAPELDAGELAQLQRYLDGQVVGAHVNVAELVDGLPASDAIRNVFRDRLDEELPDHEFDLDQETARRFMTTKRFKGDNGLRLSVRSELFDDMVDVEPPDEDGFWRITVTTRTWEQE